MGNEQSFWAEIGNDEAVVLSTSADVAAAYPTTTDLFPYTTTDLGLAGETITGNTLAVDDNYVAYSGSTIDLSTMAFDYNTVNAVDASRVTSGMYLVGNAVNNTLISGTRNSIVEQRVVKKFSKRKELRLNG